MASDTPLSGLIASAADSRLYSEVSQDTLNEPGNLGKDGLPVYMTTFLPEKEQAAFIDGIECTDKSSANSSVMNEESAPSKYETLSATLAGVQSTQVNLVRQLHRRMILNSQSKSKGSNVIAASTVSLPLPSTAAHTIINPPLTPAQSAEAMGFARGIIQEHIHSLQQYNQIRDIGQGLIGIVAEKRKVRVKDCQEEFGVTDGD